MKALFVHDHRFSEINGDYYSPGGLPNTAWDRYFNTGMIDKLIVVGRGDKSEKVDEGLVQSSTEKTEFDLLYNVNGGFEYYTKKALIRNHLENHIKKVDYVIIRNSNLGRVAGQICRKMGKPYITEVVSCAWDVTWNYGGIIGRIMAPKSFLSTRRVVLHSFATLYVTESYLQNRYPTNAEITSYSSDVEISMTNNGLIESRLVYLKQKQADNTLKIGQVGDIGARYKGFDIALKAFCTLKMKNPEINFKFYMVGGGESSYVESIIKKYRLDDNVEIVGRLESGEEGIFKFLDTLDLYIHPSRTEGLPRAVIEAISRACPVLASSVGGMPELVPNKYLHKPGDHNKLYSDLAEILTDVDQRVDMATENFEKSKEYSRDFLAKRMSDFYKKSFNAIDSLRKENS
jgi:glycosyltransferase involved in cell wall biosynthesis